MTHSWHIVTRRTPSSRRRPSARLARCRAPTPKIRAAPTTTIHPSVTRARAVVIRVVGVVDARATRSRRKHARAR